jgi:hypothetical protein
LKQALSIRARQQCHHAQYRNQKDSDSADSHLFSLLCEVTSQHCQMLQKHCSTKIKACKAPVVAHKNGYHNLTGSS